MNKKHKDLTPPTTIATTEARKLKVARLPRKSIKSLSLEIEALRASFKVLQDNFNILAKNLGIITIEDNEDEKLDRAIREQGGIRFGN